MAEDVGEGRVEVAVDFDIGYVDAGAVGALDKLLHGLAAVLDDFSGVALEEDFTDGLLVVGWVHGVGEMPGRVEGIGEGKVLFGNDPA